MLTALLSLAWIVGAVDDQTTDLDGSVRNITLTSSISGTDITFVVRMPSDAPLINDTIYHSVIQIGSVESDFTTGFGLYDYYANAGTHGNRNSTYFVLGSPTWAADVQDWLDNHKTDPLYTNGWVYTVEGDSIVMTATFNYLALRNGLSGGPSPIVHTDQVGAVSTDSFFIRVSYYADNGALYSVDPVTGLLVNGAKHYSKTFYLSTRINTAGTVISHHLSHIAAQFGHIKAALLDQGQLSLIYSVCTFPEGYGNTVHLVEPQPYTWTYGPTTLTFEPYAHVGSTALIFNGVNNEDYTLYTCATNTVYQPSGPSDCCFDVVYIANRTVTSTEAELLNDVGAPLHVFKFNGVYQDDEYGQFWNIFQSPSVGIEILSTEEMGWPIHVNWFNDEDCTVPTSTDPTERRHISMLRYWVAYLEVDPDSIGTSQEPSLTFIDDPVHCEFNGYQEYSGGMPPNCSIATTFNSLVDISPQSSPYDSVIGEVYALRACPASVTQTTSALCGVWNPTRVNGVPFGVRNPDVYLEMFFNITIPPAPSAWQSDEPIDSELLMKIYNPRPDPQTATSSWFTHMGDMFPFGFCDSIYHHSMFTIDCTLDCCGDVCNDTSSDVIHAHAVGAGIVAGAVVLCCLCICMSHCTCPCPVVFVDRKGEYSNLPSDAEPILTMKSKISANRIAGDKCDVSDDEERGVDPEAAYESVIVKRVFKAALRASHQT